MKILITGGHLMPALALIDRLLKEKKFDITFVGRKFNLDSEQTYSLEYREIEKRGLKFKPLIAGRLKREVSWSSLKNLFLAAAGLVNSWRIISEVKPEIIFSFGSYLGFPLVFAGWTKKIPVFIHEQTLRPGLGNRLSGFFAKKVFVSFPEAAKFFNQKKVVVSGNPIRKEVFSDQETDLKIEKDRPVIYITGGSLGSHSLNLHVRQIIAELLKKYIIIHQTGNVSEYRDYQTLLDLKNKMPERLKNRYYLSEHIYSYDIGYIYSLADLVVSRAGANTFFELIALKKPAVLVPLPWSANAEQQKHAEIFAGAGLGEIFSQFDSNQRLLSLIEKMMADLNQYRKNFISLQSLYRQDAVETIYENIFKR